MFSLVTTKTLMISKNSFAGLPLPDQRGNDGGDRLLGAEDAVEDRADDADLRELNLHQAKPDN